MRKLFVFLPCSGNSYTYGSIGIVAEKFEDCERILDLHGDVEDRDICNHLVMADQSKENSNFYLIREYELQGNYFDSLEWFEIENC